MRRGFGAVVSGCLLAIVACGTDQGVGEQASAVLTPHVQAVRAAAGRADHQGAAVELAQLRQAVAELQASGELSESEAAGVLQAALDVERQLTRLPAPPPPERDEGPGASSPADDGDDDDKENGADDARKRAEEAVKKAEEEAKKRAEDARQKAEDAGKE